MKMRKNAPRKWLHATLDLLPVILIPIFMIYSHRHDINNGTLEVKEKISVDFNQNVINGKPLVNTSYITSRLGNISIVDELLEYELTSLGSYSYSNVLQFQCGDFSSSNKYYVSFDIKVPHIGLYYNYIIGNSGTSNIGNSFTISSTDEFYHFSYIYNGVGSYAYVQPTFNVLNNGYSIGDKIYITNVMLFDLTKMFGVGNEPTLETFDVMFPNDYYAYTLSKKMLVDKPSLTTYNDTDIMSQFTYQLYNAVDKYFNFNNVFGMNNIYEWFELNILGGSGPLLMSVVWNIVLYEFVMDLLFLLYALFMWFIDMCSSLIESTYTKASGGK